MQALPLVDRLYITKVHATLQGDVTFPDIDTKIWQQQLVLLSTKQMPITNTTLAFTEYIKAYRIWLDYYKNKPTNFIT
jgi:dihydrofolate reductase